MQGQNSMQTLHHSCLLVSQGMHLKGFQVKCELEGVPDNFQWKEPCNDEYYKEGILTIKSLWKFIHRNTFTRFSNKYLKMISKQINLKTKFFQGISIWLINWIEILYCKKFKHTKQIMTSIKKLENITQVAIFLSLRNVIKNWLLLLVKCTKENKQLWAQV